MLGINIALTEMSILYVHFIVALIILELGGCPTTTPYGYLGNESPMEIMLVYSTCVLFTLNDQ